MLQIPERVLTDYDKDVLNSISDKINQGVDFLNDETYMSLSDQEKYLYLGLMRGMNTILSIMTKDNIPEVNNLLENYFDLIEPESPKENE